MKWRRTAFLSSFILHPSFWLALARGLRQRVFYLFLSTPRASRLSLFLVLFEQGKLARRLVRPLEPRVCDEQLVARARVSLTNPRRAFEHADGLFVALRSHEQAAQVVSRVKVSRVERDGATKKLLGLSVAPSLADDEAEVAG